MSASPERCIVCGDVPVAWLSGERFAVLRSPGCGLEWQRPFPEPAVLRRLYDRGYLERWGIDGPEALARVRAMKEASYRGFFAELRGHRTRGRLLDVGCALGFLLGVAREEGFEAYGLDVNPDAVRSAREEFGERVHAGPLDEAAFPGVSFDVVTLIDVLEHEPDPAALLASVRARLVPGGLVLAVLPNAASLTRRLLGARWPHYAPEHLFHWTPASLARFLEASGWEVRALRTGIRKSYTARYLRAYARQVGAWLPPGLGLLGDLRLRVPTGEMLAIAAAPPDETPACDTEAERRPAPPP